MTVLNPWTTALTSPAAWYPDPESPDGERWWNGSQWTSHTRASNRFVLDPSAEAQSPTAWSAVPGPLATLQPAYTAGTDYTPGTDSYDHGHGSASLASAPPVPPGWYPDPHGAPAQRWFDGARWSSQMAPQPGYPPYGTTTVVTVATPKSAGVAFLLTFFFGPWGMFYSTVSGALIMLGISIVGGIIVGIMTLGLAWLIWGPAMWVTSIIWGCSAASKQQDTQVITVYR